MLFKSVYILQKEIVERFNNLYWGWETIKWRNIVTFFIFILIKYIGALLGYSGALSEFYQQYYSVQV